MCRTVVVGDSIAWGSYDPVGGGWVNKLVLAGQKAPGSTRLSRTVCYSEVFNLGIGGDNVRSLLARFDVEVPARRPDLIVIAIGINDAAHERVPATPIANFAADYDSVVAKAAQLVAQVVLVTPTNVDEARQEHDWANDDIARYVGVIKQIGAERQLEVLDVFGALEPADLEPDGIHPGTKGHQKLFDIISPAILKRWSTHSR